MKNGQPPEVPDSPPRPRRAFESEYLAALADLVPLNTWRKICRKAIEDAKYGDPKARDWLARYLIGPDPLRLLHLAADEESAYGVVDEIERERKSRERMRLLDRLCSP
jgi:hypothetical protein